MSDSELTLLTDPHRLQSDIKLAHRAVKERWPIVDKHKATLIERLMTVVNKEQVAVMTKAGPFLSDGEADKNAVAAARVLAMMEGQNQKDQHHAEGEKVQHEHIVDFNSRRARLIEKIDLLRDRAGIGGDRAVIEQPGFGGPVGDDDEADAETARLPESEV